RIDGGAWPAHAAHRVDRGRPDGRRLEWAEGFPVGVDDLPLLPEAGRGRGAGGGLISTMGRVPAPTLILASRSPRRALLLREAGFTFEQADPPFIDPAQPRGNKVETLAMALAVEKATSLLREPAFAERGDVVVLGA